ncbi:MAG: SLBB domain-containing protein [Candidatus Syntrophosphaera sp.]|nr:SLBB domain-containing protein [Candidatus Syntrophosphaera sp.]
MKTKLLILALLCLWCFAAAQITLPKDLQAVISVNVTGFVANPGTYQVAPVNRLSDVLTLANTAIKTIGASEVALMQQMKEAAQDSLYANFQALRSVEILRGGETITCDLQKFLRGGDLTQNPLLRDGDVIRVKAVRASVSIQGEVYYPGEYEFVEGDQLSDLLDLAQGFTPAADLKAVSIYRYQENMTDHDLLRIDLRTGSTDNIELQASDRVTVPRDSEFRRAWKITVGGNVKASGEYLIDGTTTLYDILLLCGGPTANGDLRRAIYASSVYSKDPDPEFERLKEFSLSQISALEYHYLSNKMRQFPGKYSVDVSQAWDSQGALGNPVLRDGDYLFVPEKLDMVMVSGQVANPGLVPWIEGKTWKHYIDEAGGFTNNKRWRGTRIIRMASGNWVRPSDKIPVHPGDNIFVAERTEREFWTDVKDVLLAATQVMTIFLGVRAITSN